MSVPNLKRDKIMTMFTVNKNIPLPTKIGRIGDLRWAMLDMDIGDCVTIPATSNATAITLCGKTASIARSLWGMGGYAAIVATDGSYARVWRLK